MPRSVDTVLTINPDGTISADFTGHISAQGIDLLTGSAANPPADRKIRWHQTDIHTGAVVAELESFEELSNAAERFTVRSIGTVGFRQNAITALQALAADTHIGTLILEQVASAHNAGSILSIRFDDQAAGTVIMDGTGNSGLMPVGTIIPFAGDTSLPLGNIPLGWMLCNGASLLRSAFTTLFSVIGTLYGTVDGTHFNLPDCRGRTLIGYGPGPGLTNRVLGSIGGEENHALATAEMPSHTHTGPSHTHTGPSHNHTGVVGGVLSSIDHLHVAVGVGNSYGFTNQPPNLSWGVAAGGGASYITGISATTGAADRSLDHQHGIVADGTAATGASGTAVTGATGGAGSPLHNNMEPWMAIQYLIRVGDQIP